MTPAPVSRSSWSGLTVLLNTAWSWRAQFHAKISRVSVRRMAARMRAWKRKCCCSSSQHWNICTGMSSHRTYWFPQTHMTSSFDFGCGDLLKDLAYRLFADWFVLQQERSHYITLLDVFVHGYLWTFDDQTKRNYSDVKIFWTGPFSVHVFGVVWSLVHSSVHPSWVVSSAPLSCRTGFCLVSGDALQHPVQLFALQSRMESHLQKHTALLLESCLQARDKNHVQTEMKFNV